MSIGISEDNTQELLINENEKVEYKLNERGFEIIAFYIWSKSFDSWLKQDLLTAVKYYSLEYEKIIRLVDGKIKSEDQLC